jgi:polyisoprenoid-binding protein YceI
LTAEGRPNPKDLKTMKPLFYACAALALAACSPPAAEKKTDAAPAAPAAPAPNPVPADLPAGAYTIDKAHTSVVFKVDHLGFSNYTGHFTNVDGKLQLDPRNPATAQLEVTIDPRSLDLTAPPAGFKESLLGNEWLDAGKYPQMTFRSTRVDVTGPDTARITGDFTLHGVTKPVVLEARFNGGYAGHPKDPHARIGFSAHGTLKRSDFGIAYGIPAPGTKVGVSDAVQVIVETELNGPPLASAAASTPAPKS